MARTPQLVPESNFPGDALQGSIQVPPDVLNAPASMVFTWNIASAADAISPWGRNVGLRDRQLRDFWPTEPFLAGSIANVSFRNAAYEWEVRGPSTTVEKAITDMLSAAIAGDSFGWSNFVMKYSQDLYTQDNGAFIELIRDPGVDANSRFKNEFAPVLGISHLDSNQCTRTGNPTNPVIYTDRRGKDHKLAWYQVIPFSDYPSTIERMNGVGVCAASRSLRLAQIMRSIFIFKDEKISGRHYKSIHIVSGISRQDLLDVTKRGKEDADNAGQIRYIDPAILASLDPEKPVSTATIDLANLPDGFNYDQEMKWYITGLALCFGVDYQDFAPLSSGAIGSSNQSQMLNQKSAGKGPAMFMKISQALANYGVLPRGYEMVFEDRDEQRELDKETLRRTFQEEMALAVRNFILTPAAARKLGVKLGFYTETDIQDIPADYGLGMIPAGQNLGNTGGNTIAQDASRTDVGVPDNLGGNQLMKDRNSQPVIKVFNNVPDPEGWKPPDVIVNVPPAQVTVNVPEQAAPIVNIAAPAPQPPADVHVEVSPTPVTVKNNIQPAPPAEDPVNKKEKEQILAGIRKLLKDE